MDTVGLNFECVTVNEGCLFFFFLHKMYDFSYNVMVILEYLTAKHISLNAFSNNQPSWWIPSPGRRSARSLSQPLSLPLISLWSLPANLQVSPALLPLKELKNYGLAPLRPPQPLLLGDKRAKPGRGGIGDSAVLKMLWRLALVQSEHACMCIYICLFRF